jgi:hypothetical protein
VNWSYDGAYQTHNGLRSSVILNGWWRWMHCYSNYAAKPPADWASVLDLASAHGVDGFLYSRVRAWDPSLRPAAPLMARWRTSFLGAASMWAVHAAALGRAVPDFIDWTDLHPTEKNVWLAWHCGNAAPSLAAPGCKKRLLRNERMIQWCPQCHGALEFRLKPGPITCARLVEYGGEYTFFFGTGEVVDIPPFVRGAYAWVRVNDLADWEAKMVEHGVIHHGTLIHDPMVADALDWFCKFLGIHAVRGA